MGVKKLKEENTLLRVENTLLSEENKTLRDQLKESEEKGQARRRFTLNDIKNNDKLVAHYTGMPTIGAFNLLLSIFENQALTYYLGWKVTSVSRENQLLMCLMKLRRNLSHLDLAFRFLVTEATVTNVVRTWLSALHIALVEDLMNKVPSRDKNRKSLPKCFSQYASCRMIIDCTEFFSANPKAMNISNAMYSSYKSRITLKACIGVAPNGCVTLCSKAYSGSTSDKDIVADCGRNIRTRRYYGRQRFSDW